MPHGTQRLWEKALSCAQCPWVPTEATIRTCTCVAPTETEAPLPPEGPPPDARGRDADLQVLAPQGLDVRVDAADLGPLALLQLALHLLPVGVLHGFDGCGQGHAPALRGWAGQTLGVLNKRLQNDEWVSSKINKEVRRYPENNENENTTLQTLWGQ